MSLAFADHIYILGILGATGHPNYVRSADSCPVFKGNTPSFIYMDGSTIVGYDADQEGWNMEDDQNGSSGVIKTNTFSHVLLTLHFY
jgi:hypothetical protein